VTHTTQHIRQQTNQPRRVSYTRPSVFDLVFSRAHVLNALASGSLVRDELCGLGHATPTLNPSRPRPIKRQAMIPPLNIEENSKVATPIFVQFVFQSVPTRSPVPTFGPSPNQLSPT